MTILFQNEEQPTDTGKNGLTSVFLGGRHRSVSTALNFLFYMQQEGLVSFRKKNTQLYEYIIFVVK